MKEILNELYKHKTLTKNQAKEVLIDIAQEKYNEIEITSFLTVFILRTITVDELEGFRDAILSLCTPIDLTEYDPIDLCGTGGDEKNTFNISTISSFIVAGAGIPVAKHGNYGVSSISGSSNVMEFLGLKFTNDEKRLKEQIAKANICFLHAPLFHSAMKNVAPIRKKMGVKTFFNMLGPLVNPAKPKKQMVGVYSLELARIYEYIYQNTEKEFTIVHSLDGFDEISLTGQFKITRNNGSDILSPTHFGYNTVNCKELEGGDSVKEAAAIFMKILNGQGSETQNKVVLANSALAIQTYYPQLKISECLQKAEESLRNKKALKAFNTLLKIN